MSWKDLEAEEVAEAAVVALGAVAEVALGVEEAEVALEAVAEVALEAVEGHSVATTEERLDTVDFVVDI